MQMVSANTSLANHTFFRLSPSLTHSSSLSLSLSLSLVTGAVTGKRAEGYKSRGVGLYDEWFTELIGTHAKTFWQALNHSLSLSFSLFSQSPQSLCQGLLCKPTCSFSLSGVWSGHKFNLSLSLSLSLLSLSLSLYVYICLSFTDTPTPVISPAYFHCEGCPWT